MHTHKVSQIWYPDKEVDYEVLTYQAYNLYKGQFPLFSKENLIGNRFRKKNGLELSMSFWNMWATLNMVDNILYPVYMKMYTTQEFISSTSIFSSILWGYSKEEDLNKFCTISLQTVIFVQSFSRVQLFATPWVAAH